MPSFKIEDILSVSGGRLIAGSCAESAAISGISTDTRAIKPGELFLAIKGKNYDGHNFIQEAVRRGAVCAIISQEAYPEKYNIPLIKVEDTLDAFGRIAAWHRKKFDIPVAGITGSNGKTTTKDMIAHLASSKFKVLKS